MVAARAAVRLHRRGARDAPYNPAPVALLDARRVPGSERPRSLQVFARTAGHARDDTAQVVVPTAAVRTSDGHGDRLSWCAS